MLLLQLHQMDCQGFIVKLPTRGAFPTNVSMVSRVELVDLEHIQCPGRGIIFQKQNWGGVLSTSTIGFGTRGNIKCPLSWDVGPILVEVDRLRHLLSRRRGRLGYRSFNCRRQRDTTPALRRLATQLPGRDLVIAFLVGVDRFLGRLH
jgi:hypothetical protein